MPEEKQEKEKITDDYDVLNLLTGIHNPTSMISRNLPLATLTEKARTYIIKQSVLVKLMHDFIAKPIPEEPPPESIYWENWQKNEYTQKIKQINKQRKEDGKQLVETFMTQMETMCLTERNQKTNVALVGFLQKGSDKKITEEIKEPQGGIIKTIKNIAGRKKDKDNE